MTYIADLHLHSYYARATSKELTLENLAKWARIKGIDLLSSADFTHPAWIEETRRKLQEDASGFYTLDGVRFILGTEVNCTGYQGGRHRRIHMLLFAPDISTAERINKAIAGKGSLGSDGRPTLKLLPKDLVSLVLDIDIRCIIMPAHAWTPWFGVLGSKSGFDSLAEAFGDNLAHVYAIETGLSSDPSMNWRVSELDNISIVSFSDAHSLPKMGREVTAFNGELSYDGFLQSLKSQNIAYTIEFFPEEGKYHYSGHRKCGISSDPEEVRKLGGTCPSCGRRMTLGVMQRVEELANRDVQVWRDDDGLIKSDRDRPPFISVVGLQQIIAENFGRGVNTKGVREEYQRLVGELGSELSVLTSVDIADIMHVAGERVADGVNRVRRGRIHIKPGYDGVYGEVKVWDKGYVQERMRGV